MIDDGKAVLRVRVCPPKDSGRAFYNVAYQELQDAIDSQYEWIIDRIYDTAIHNLETEIALLAEAVMKNLIRSHKPY